MEIETVTALYGCIESPASGICRICRRRPDPLSLERQRLLELLRQRQPVEAALCLIHGHGSPAEGGGSRCIGRWAWTSCPISQEPFAHTLGHALKELPRYVRHGGYWLDDLGPQAALKVGVLLDIEERDGP